MVNPTHAPRAPKCRVCLLVAVPEDVTIRLYGPELKHLPTVGAVEYLQSVGLAGTVRQLTAIALTHRHHVDQYIAKDGASAPAQYPDGMSRIPPPIGNVAWVDVNQGVMGVGAQATAVLEERIRTQGKDMDTKDLVAIMGAGSSAATMRAAAEMKGQIKRAEAFARLASGIKRPEPV